MFGDHNSFCLFVCWAAKSVFRTNENTIFVLLEFPYIVELIIIF